MNRGMRAMCGELELELQLQLKQISDKCMLHADSCRNFDCATD